MLIDRTGWADAKLIAFERPAIFLLNPRRRENDVRRAFSDSVEGIASYLEEWGREDPRDFRLKPSTLRCI
jgi:hypothetical protein